MLSPRFDGTDERNALSKQEPYEHTVLNDANPHRSDPMTKRLMQFSLPAIVLGAAMTALAGTGAAVAASADATVISLTQTACQFIESENGVDRGYTTHKKADCDAINARTGAARVTESKTLHLKPGKYTFRVTNRDVPYELGFWVRAESLINRVLLPSTSGGGLVEGKTQDYTIELKPGKYIYSCPLNTTPDYRLVVEG